MLASPAFSFPTQREGKKKKETNQASSRIWDDGVSGTVAINVSPFQVHRGIRVPTCPNGASLSNHGLQYKDARRRVQYSNTSVRVLY